jgi:hypothetical protein
MSARARAFWALFAAMTAVFLAMAVWTMPEIAAQAGGLKTFDLRTSGYDEIETRAFLEALSAKGRALYLGRQHWLDTAFPALLAATLIYALFWVFPKAGNAARLAIIGVPGTAAVFDYLENARVGAMLSKVPQDVTADMIAAANSATTIKFALLILTFAVLFLALAARLFSKWNRRND